MGAKHSQSKLKPEEPMLSQEEVIRLMRAQTAEMYENFRKELVDSARSIELANTVASLKPTPATPSSQTPVTQTPSYSAQTPSYSAQTPITPSSQTLTSSANVTQCSTQDVGSWKFAAPHNSTEDHQQNTTSYSTPSGPINLYPNLHTVSNSPPSWRKSNEDKTSHKSQELTVNDAKHIERTLPSAQLPRSEIGSADSRPPRRPWPLVREIEPTRTDNRTHPSTLVPPQKAQAPTVMKSWRAPVVQQTASGPAEIRRPRTPSPQVMRQTESGRVNNRYPRTPSPPVVRQTERTRTDNRCSNNIIMDCSTCYAEMGPLIYKCDSGHSSCEYCKVNPGICGICSAYIRHTANEYDQTERGRTDNRRPRTPSPQLVRQTESGRVNNRCSRTPSPSLVRQTESARTDNRSRRTSVIGQTGGGRPDNRYNNSDIMECSTCYSEIGPLFFKCDKGHGSCEFCRQVARKCGICSGHLRHAVYNLPGRYIDKEIPCPYKIDGCKLVIKMSKMEAHINECPFKILQCPLRCCNVWTGKLDQLCSHFDILHPELLADVDTEIQIQNISKNSQDLYLILIRCYNFLFHVKVQNRAIYMTAQLVGTKMSADKWSYEVHVYNKNDMSRLYTFEDVCSSHTTPVDDIFEKGSCLILPQVYATTFMHGKGLTYKFYIKRTIQSRTRRNVFINQKYI